MTLRYLLFIGWGLLLPGCSVIKSLKKQPVEPPKTEHPVAPQATKPAVGTPPVRTVEVRKEPPQADTLVQSSSLAVQEEPQPEAPLPEICFPESETQHVRLSMARYNPFPDSGELAICLDDLRAKFCYPYCGKMISPFGMRGRSMHTGMDIKAVPRDTIRAAFAGVVRMAKLYSGYGYIVVIRHYNGIETAYAHHTKNLVEVNDVVKEGDPIGLAGRTGRATTEHLHFELRVGGEPVNPALILDYENYGLRDGTLYLSNRGGRIRASHTPLAPYTDQHLAAAGNPDERTATAAASSASAAKPSSASTPAVRPVVSSQPASSSPLYHTIKSGDTLSALARRYGTSVQKICGLNGIQPTKILQLKERLRVK